MCTYLSDPLPTQTTKQLIIHTTKTQYKQQQQQQQQQQQNQPKSTPPPPPPPPKQKKQQKKLDRVFTLFSIYQQSIRIREDSQAEGTTTVPIN